MLDFLAWDPSQIQAAMWLWWDQEEPSKHASSDSHPIWIGSEVLARSRPSDSSRSHTGLLSDRICLAKTRHCQVDPDRIWAGFAQYDPGHLWENATESESGKLVAGRLCSASESFTPACLRTRCIWPKPDQATQIRSGPVDPLLIMTAWCTVSCYGKPQRPWCHMYM